MKLFLSCFFLFFMGVPVFGQDALKTIVAEPGDGILSLLRKQGVEDPYRYYDAFIDLNQEQLRDSVHLYAGREYKIPEVAMPKEDTKKEKGEHTFPILGPDHETVIIKSKRLEGAVYYLVSGHGGPDPGAMAVYKGKSLAEDEYAYDITLRLARELLSHSATVYLIIRDDDGIRNERILPLDRDEVAYPDLEIPLDQVKRLKQRVHIVNKLYKKHKGSYQRLIVTHIDSRSVGQNIDVFFYHHEKSKNGKRLAESIHKTFKAKYKKYQPNRVYSGTFEDRSTLYLVRKTHPAMTFIEVGNIKNKKDQKRILEPDNRQALAKWISEGVLLDYEEE